MKKQYQYILLFSIVTIMILLSGCNRHKAVNLENTIIEIDAVAPRLLNKYHANGAAIALVHGGEVVWAKGYGYSNTEKGIKVTPNTVFQAASISKSVTAWAVMKLIEEGKIELDTPIEEYLNRWQLPATQFNSKGVTVRRILSHTAGLSLSGFRGIHPEEKIPTLEESLSGNNSSNKTIVHVTKEPGIEFAYSGGGYMLLSLLVEEVTGELFEDYIQREVLSPLGMSNSSYYWTDSIKKITAIGYNREGLPLPNYLFTSKGAASLYTTANDLAKWVAASMKDKDGNLSDRNVLMPETIDFMFTPVMSTKGDINLFFDEVCLGYFRDHLGMISHTGSNQGWRNIFALYPKSGDGIVVLTNSERGRNVYVDILNIWSQSITGKVSKMGAFFNKVFQISITITIILYFSLILYIVIFIRQILHSKRLIFWHIRISIWRISLRFLILVFIPIIVTYFFNAVIYGLLLDISPLSSEWMLYAIMLWSMMAIILAFFPKVKNIKPKSIN